MAKQNVRGEKVKGLNGAQERRRKDRRVKGVTGSSIRESEGGRMYGKENSDDNNQRLGI